MIQAQSTDASCTLYPPIEPYRTGFLSVSDVHEIYYEECGNPEGKPAVFLHRGPGAGTEPNVRRFFDPHKYHVVVFDQRVCGQSRPNATLVDNTTWHLVEDIEKLRAHLAIDRWLVFGGFWGSTLALAYAQRHPQAVTELVLRGIFLLRHSELEWFYQSTNGAASLFPDLWEQYVAPIPSNERNDMIRAYYRRLTSSDSAVQLSAARAWTIWEGATSFLQRNPDYVARCQEDTFATAFARIECHYFLNCAFFETDDQLLRNIDRIRHIPAIVVQGRCDVVCPMRSACDLYRAWGEADLVIVPDAGHSALEPGVTRDLIAAPDRFAG